MGGINGILGGGALRLMWAGAAGGVVLILTACAATPPRQTAASSLEPPAADYGKAAANSEGLEARIARLEHDLAQLRIDYSVVRPDMERIIARDGSVEYRVSAIEQALGFTTGSITSPTPSSASPPSPPTTPPSSPASQDAPASGPASQDAPASGYGVHLASYRGEKALQQGWRELQEANADLLKGLKPQERLIDTGSDGVYRRLIAGPIRDKATAAHLCEAFKGRGIWCQTLPLAAK